MGLEGAGHHVGLEQCTGHDGAGHHKGLEQYTGLEDADQHKGLEQCTSHESADHLRAQCCVRVFDVRIIMKGIEQRTPTIQNRSRWIPSSGAEGFKSGAWMRYNVCTSASQFAAEL